jgi:catechol 2,3-dioxygenase-like lactoylglutathione lyase family enzyme
MRNLNLLVLRCREMERTKAFYSLFGLNFVKEQHAAGPEHFSATDDVGTFELYPADSGAADRTGLGFAFTDIEPIHMALRKAQYAPQKVRETELGRTFIVYDPDGRRVEIKQLP